MLVVKIAISVALLLGAAELAKRDTLLGALVIMLPLTSMLSIALLYIDTGDGARVTRYAREIFYLVPVSLLFFLPFVAQPRTQWPFWVNFGLGVALLAVAVLALRILIK